MNATHELLRALCAAEPVPADAGFPADPVAAARALDEPALLRLLEAAEVHRVAGLVLRRLEGDDFADWTETVAPSLRARLKALRRASALAELQWERIAAALAVDGPEPVLLKGLDLARRIYDEPVERQLGDLDFLVSRRDLKRAIRALFELGYGCRHDLRGARGYLRHHFHIQMCHDGGFLVEVHWDVTRPANWFRVAPERLRAGSIQVRTPAGTPFRVADREHAILMIVLQNIQEGFSRLARLVDVDRLVRREPGPDWETLARLARTGRLSKPLALSLQLGHQALGTPLPPGFVDGLGMHAVSRAHLALFRPVRFTLNRRAMTRTAASNLLRVWLLPTAGLKLRSLASLLSHSTADPLDWLWKRDPGEPVRRSLADRIATLCKLLGYQGFLYLRGIAGWVRRDPDQGAFWR